MARMTSDERARRCTANLYEAMGALGKAPGRENVEAAMAAAIDAAVAVEREEITAARAALVAAEERERLTVERCCGQAARAIFDEAPASHDAATSALAQRVVQRIRALTPAPSPAPPTTTTGKP